MPIDPEKLNELCEAMFLHRAQKYRRPPPRPAPLTWPEMVELMRELDSAVTEEDKEAWEEACWQIWDGVPEWEQERAIRYLTSHIPPNTLAYYYNTAPAEGEEDQVDDDFQELASAILAHYLWIGGFDWYRSEFYLERLLWPLLRAASRHYKELIQCGDWEAFLERSRQEFPELPTTDRNWLASILQDILDLPKNITNRYRTRKQKPRD